MSRSVLQDRNDRECYLCKRGFPGGFGGLEEHHIFYGAGQRELSEHYGLKVLLCRGHHREGPEAVHKNAGNREYLCRIAQEAFEDWYGHENYRKTFGKNYLEEKEWKMNKVILMGRLTKDPNIRYTQGETPMCVAKYTIAVNRRAAGKDQADFIGCTSFGKAGEFVEKYLKKGSKIIITGRIQTGSYTDQEGTKRYTTEVVTEEIEFAESKAVATSQRGGEDDSDTGDNGFMTVTEEDEEGLPFN